MWGSTFADLAKKAQELQEQAKEQASHLHVPVCSSVVVVVSVMMLMMMMMM